LTNKLNGRIGDTPTIGAGFWAEEWDESPLESERRARRRQEVAFSGLSNVADGLRSVLGDCIPNISGYQSIPPIPSIISEKSTNIRAVAMSGTGNGDSFLRLAAVRTAGAIVRFAPDRSLASAVNQIVGPGGEMQRSAGDRWGNGEGSGGIIGIELVDGKGNVVYDFNCGGMFRCWVDEMGKERVMVFRDEY
jgi:L-asparaginase